MTTTSTSTSTETARTEGAQRARERMNMNPQLAKIADRWASEEQQLDKSELEIRYRWAQDVKTVRDSPDRYGTNADKKLFQARMTQELDPRVYYNVATFIDASFFESVVAFNKSKTARNGHITFSHLIAFARIGDTETRDSLLKQCMTEQWSVATLRDKMNEALDDGDVESTTERRQAGAGSIAKRLARSAQKLERDTMVIFGEKFRLSLDSVRESDRDETRALVETAKQAVSDCKVMLGTAEQAFDRALKSLVSPVSDSQVIESEGTECVSPKRMPVAETPPERPTGERKVKRVQRPVTPTVDRQALATV